MWLCPSSTHVRHVGSSQFRDRKTEAWSLQFSFSWFQPPHRHSGLFVNLSALASSPQLPLNSSHSTSCLSVPQTHSKESFPAPGPLPMLFPLSDTGKLSPSPLPFPPNPPLPLLETLDDLVLALSRISTDPDGHLGAAQLVPEPLCSTQRHLQAGTRTVILETRTVFVTITYPPLWTIPQPRPPCRTRRLPQARPTESGTALAWPPVPSAWQFLKFGKTEAIWPGPSPQNEVT